MFYAPSTKGFYEPDTVMPDDAIELSIEKYKALRDGQSGILEIGMVDGQPALVERVADEQETKRMAISSIKTQLGLIDAKKVRAITDAILSGSNTRLQELETQAQTLRNDLQALGG